MLLSIEFVKNYWKQILIVAYAIFVPLYFLQSTKSTQEALIASRASSSAQINILQNALDEQRVRYDQMFEEYQIKMEEEEIRFQEEIKKIKLTQEQQQKELSKKFKDNPSSIKDELSNRYNLNGK